jgi:hypothetical protein
MSDNEVTEPTASNGQPAAQEARDPRGRFAPGNRAAKGNPLAKKAAQLRGALLRAVSSGDLRIVVKELVRQAKAGDVQAAKLLLDRTLGPAVPVDLLERIERVENILDGNAK